jgi:hypothetical protein
MEVWIIPAVVGGGLCIAWILAEWGLWLFQMGMLIGAIYLIYRLLSFLF